MAAARSAQAGVIFLATLCLLASAACLARVPYVPVLKSGTREIFRRGGNRR
jgi:hypothetical protein